jgi:hypothetical protein
MGNLSRQMQLTALLALSMVGLSTGALNAEPVSEQQAHAIGVDAYLYFYSPITMDLTRKQLTNVEPGKGFGGPTNTFANVPAYPTAADRAVVRPNFDTLYSSAWLDLTREPMVVSVPTPVGAIIFCRCWICGLTCLHLRDGGPQARRRRPS